MPTKKETMKMAEAESGTGRDVKGVTKVGLTKADHREMHMPKHEFGPDRGGTDCHQTHRGKS